MGAWGEGPFDNDDAADFAGDLAGGVAADAPDAVTAVLSQALGDGYIEAPEMARALAASAVVALSLDALLPTPLSLSQEWIAALPAATPALLSAAAAVIVRAWDETDNEWFDLWAEAGLVEQVRAAMAPYATALRVGG